MEEWPWWVGPFLSERLLIVDGVERGTYDLNLFVHLTCVYLSLLMPPHPPSSGSLFTTTTDDLLSSQSYTPSIPHIRPSILLTHLILPANTTISLSLPFLKQFLRYNEHPPDAARGFELTAAVLFPLKRSEDDDNVPERILSSNLLMDLATPDFSMPYNVIIMSSTLLALFFGR